MSSCIAVVSFWKSSHLAMSLARDLLSSRVPSASLGPSMVYCDMIDGLSHPRSKSTSRYPLALPT